MNGSHQDGTYRAEFLAVLDEALHSEEIRRALREAGAGSGSPEPPLGVELLRARAVQAADVIAEAAADEYARYTALRDAPSAGGRARRARGGSGTGGGGLAGSDGPGVTATLAVLVPMLSGIAAVTFLALGFGLRAAGSGHRVTTSLTGVGFTTAAVFGAALLVGLAGLVLTARRDAAAARAALELATARQEWRRALLVEGVLPYLRRCVGEARGASGGSAGVSLVRKRPKLGYTSPGFGSAGVSLIRQRPKLGYTSPGFSSPSDPSPS
ncbi:hypothetical protein [Actinacidiphila acidipaludis]|uniref:Transmembrane protein n=1 Tax=Actinacidiphila acidipaludis TaxID=2873382 RepID=A0ABS7QF50_9ACTN|nr:hypothetical protein [Streptomyces acidipaludis]MBY8881783.1 hypothetical protein [Streptomyces acidipaludis]